MGTMARAKRSTRLEALLAAAFIAACSGGPGSPSPAPSATPAVQTPSPVAASPTPFAWPTAVPVTATAAALTATPPPAAADEPRGFPIDPAITLGHVTGSGSGRHIEWGAGPSAAAYSEQDQVSDDPEVANDSGWDCRTHVEYEGQPAVDWYVPAGTPVLSTMDGTATLYIVTVTNAFDYYAVPGWPYLGNPDRAQAPVVPFSGPGGGKGVFVAVENPRFVTEYGHLDPARTIGAVAGGGFIAPYGPGSDYASLFGALRDFQTFTAIATGPVRRGDVIGYTDSTGYSEAPHLHYTIARAGSSSLLCPTGEAGFEDGGWLAK